jgi:thymidylate kinase
MPFIAFLGCDGSGKTSVIDGVAAEMAKRCVSVTRGHWRPAPMDAGRSQASSADDPHGKPARGFIASIMKLGWLWIAWWSGWLRECKHSAKHGLLIFDRYHADLLVDPRRYRYGGPMILARMVTSLMPQPDMAFFLDAEPQVLRARKQEVSLGSLAASRKAYLNMASQKPQIKVIDAGRPLDLVIADVLRHISELPQP